MNDVRIGGEGGITMSQVGARIGGEGARAMDGTDTNRARGDAEGRTIEPGVKGQGARVERTTRETRVQIEVARGGGVADVRTGLPLFDHMLATLLRYAALDARVEAAGDLRHHVIEDTSIALAVAVRRLIPPTCARYGERTVPMDDALVQVAIDAGGRFFFRGRVPSRLYTHALRSFAEHAGLTLHVRVLRGGDRHHVHEAAFKGLGLALRAAMADEGAVFSTKGSVRLSVEDTAKAGVAEGSCPRSA